MIIKKLKVRSLRPELRPRVLKFKVNTKVTLCLLVFSFLTFNFSLSTSSADEIHPRAAVVMDASTGRILYAKNPNLRLPPASTTKLMTAIVAIEKADLSDVIRVSKNASRASPLKAGFEEGDEVTVETLLYAALLESANDAAVALAEAVAGSEKRFVHFMNRKAIAIGLKDTNFINSSGLPGPGQYITAFDLSKIMRYALRYPKLKEIIGTRVAGVSTEKGNDLFLKNTNRLLWSDEDLIGGKTGYTRRARHCFVCAAEREKEIAIVALLGSPSREDLWKETEELIGKGFQIMANEEEPVIYFTKSDYDSFNLKRASYKKNSKFKIQNSKLKTDNKTKFVKRKGKAKTFAKGKSKRGKYSRVVKKGGNGNKG
ncbi:MAG: D-alanyl-D-alanine carboxypeptidase family protein [Nitrospirota bacterium]